MKQISNTLFPSIRFARFHFAHAIKHSVSLKVALLLGILSFAISLSWPSTQARQGGFQRGDIFVSLGNGTVQRYSQTSGALLQTLDTLSGANTFVTGSTFDRNGNFFVTGFSSRLIHRFDTNGNKLADFANDFNGRPESIVFDGSGNVYVGTVDGDNDVRKYDEAGNVLDRFDVAVDRRGSDWIDLAADKCTLYYTSQGARILRYDVCSKTQLTDFVNNLPHSAAYALRLLPGGGLLVADTVEILRLDASGNLIQRYDAPDENDWFALALDPDGTSFWASAVSGGNVYKFDIASANQITRIPAGQGGVFGLSVLGDAGANPTPSPTVTPSSTPACGDVLLAVTNGEVRRYNAEGRLSQTLNTGTGAISTGMAVDQEMNILVTTFGGQSVARFNAQGQRLGTFGSGFTGLPESIVIDGARNVYVGQAIANTRVANDADILKFAPDGTLLSRFAVQTEERGSDWIELGPDQCTMYYTSEGRSVKRFDVCRNVQLPDLVNNLPRTNVRGSGAYALRLLPRNKFPEGGLLLANWEEVLRLNEAGGIVQRYDAANENSWFALNLDPDGSSFWSAGSSSGNAFKFDINTGQVLRSFNSGAPADAFGSIIGGVAVVCELTGSGGGGVIPTDLALTKAASPSIVTNGTALTYTLNITNNGPAVATNVVLRDTLPSNTTLVSCSGNGTGVCGGEGRNRLVTFPQLAVGQTVTVSLVVRVDCLGIESTVLSNAAEVTATNADPNPANNSATTTVQVAPAQPRITIGAPEGLNFGEVVLRREGLANPQWYPFTIENTGCLPLVISLAMQRTGPDVSSGRISNANDLATFPIFVVGEGGQLLTWTSADTASIPPGFRVNFRLYFNPKIPMAAGKTTGLSANQVIPDLINSTLVVNTNGVTETGTSSFSYPVTGRVAPELKMINPLTPSLSPLVVLARNNDEFSVEFSVHDANMDTFCATYQFLNQADVPVGDAPVFYLDEDIAKANMVRGQSFTVVKKFSGANRRPEVQRVRVTVHDRQINVVETSTNVGSQQGRVVNVSAASFAALGLSAESIVAAFGSRLAVETRSAGTTPLPTVLAGTRVLITDSNNVEHAAPLFFVAPGQVNYIVPRGVANGPATVTIAAADGAISTGNITVADVAPALFTADASGKGLPTGLVFRVKANGAQVYEPLAQFNATTRKFDPVAIDVSNSKEQVYLVLFGTGFRYRRAPQGIRATVGGLDVPVIFAGKQGGLVGVDQVNLLLPNRLAGRGEVEIQLFVDGKAANPVRVQIR